MKQIKTDFNVLPSPQKPVHLPDDVQWLSGEGAGSWFSIAEQQQNYIISRYSPEGKLECTGFFEQISGESFKKDRQYQFTYLSHCAEVTIEQENRKIIFKKIF